MEIEISKKITKNIEKASKKLGISKNDVVARALFLYLRNVKEFVSLQEEIQSGEETSAKDAVNFFKKHNL